MVTTVNPLELTQQLLRSSMQLSEKTLLTPDTELMAAFPEFNSLTITTLIMQIEESVDCEIDDDEINGEIFETVGSLTEFIAVKMNYS